MKNDIGVLIGRFQIDELHDGHKDAIDQVIKKNNNVIILIGVSPTLGTKKNPLDYRSRLGLFDKYKDFYQDGILIQPLPDVPGNDMLWSKEIDRIIRLNFPLGNVTIYGSSDNFINSYKGRFKAEIIHIENPVSATPIRKLIGKIVINSNDFRAGQIYQSQNQYPKVFPTVDIAVVKKDSKDYYVLMGKKESYNGLVFIGGFVDPTDNSYEDACKRELFEEVGVDIEVDKFEYIGSSLINDPRYDGEEKIVTSFFMTKYLFGNKENIKEEFVKLDWVKVCADNIKSVNEIHHSLFRILLNKLSKKE